MTQGVQVHLDEIIEFQSSLQNLHKDYGKNKKNNIRINQEMTVIKGVCEKYI